MKNNADAARIGDKVIGTDIRSGDSFYGDVEFIEPNVAFGLSLYYVRNAISHTVVAMDDPVRMA